MRYEDIKSIEEGFSPRECTYWVGSKIALSDGRYDDLRPVIVLARGAYTEYRGQCGVEVKPFSGAVKRLVVATWSEASWRRGTYCKNDWVPKVIQTTALLITGAELTERRRLQREDQRRHIEAQEAVTKRRDELAAVMASDLLNGLGRSAKIYGRYANRGLGGAKEKPVGVHISIDLTLDQIRRKLSPEARAALREFVALKDPAC